MTKNDNNAIKIEPLDGYVYGVKFTPEQVYVLMRVIEDVEKEIKTLLISDVDELADKIIRIEYPTYEHAEPYLKNLIIRKKSTIKMIMEQYFEEILR